MITLENSEGDHRCPSSALVVSIQRNVRGGGFGEISFKADEIPQGFIEIRQQGLRSADHQQVIPEDSLSDMFGEVRHKSGQDTKQKQDRKIYNLNKVWVR